jgi:hypothetical protein
LLTISSNCFNTTKNRGKKKNKEKNEKKPTDNDLHNTTEKTKDLATGIQQKKDIVKYSDLNGYTYLANSPPSITLVKNLVVSQER